MDIKRVHCWGIGHNESLLPNEFFLYGHSNTSNLEAHTVKRSLRAVKMTNRGPKVVYSWVIGRFKNVLRNLNYPKTWFWKDNKRRKFMKLRTITHSFTSNIMHVVRRNDFKQYRIYSLMCILCIVEKFFQLTDGKG